METINKTVDNSVSRFIVLTEERQVRGKGEWSLQELAMSVSLLHREEEVANHSLGKTLSWSVALSG